MNINDNKHIYDHLLNMPHHRSKKRKHMSMVERAAQFGAFRALTGHESAISEAGRITNKKIELDEYQNSEIDLKLQYLIEYLFDAPQIKVKYFVADDKKSGGEYKTHTGSVTKLLYYEKCIVFDDGLTIYIGDILSIDGDIFEKNQL